MAFRDEMIELVDDLRREVVDQAFGLRLESVVVRRRQWSGRIGIAPYTDIDTVLDPKPRVVRPTPKLHHGEAGKYEAGDLVVDRISATYTEEQLCGNISGASELMWLINGEPYKVVGTEINYLAWKVHLRRARNKP